MIVAHELGLADQLTKIRFVASMKAPNPAIMVDNPLSKIPTLVLENGDVVFGSQTICEYLDSLIGGSKLFPPNGRARWITLTLQALGDGLLDLLILWRNEREKPETQRTPEWLSAFAFKTNATLDRLEATALSLAEAEYCVGQITIGCALSYLDFRFSDLSWREGRPKLSDWHHVFSSRPSSLATEVGNA